ncbi:MAG: peptide deformylase [Oscillospiraceae bacterium]|nr:peptide deformylase [Oscillospiraceae bacterium]
MVKDLIHDPILLARKSLPATAEDLPAARDLLDTLLAHRETCAGMAANMIGVQRCIIAFFHGPQPVLMLNPELLKTEEPYETQEGCLSLLGGPRSTRRYRKIKLRWQTEALQTRIKTFEGWTAQVIQHEIDHCQGILI